ncbi:lantibiotic dehydratase family protein [Flagellimonas olearia]|uniref:Lantibiotic dehydratase N-terminal domain-containing protein n=1 Tax=Flagellimonas olearia TaxID=552546 RepID=A0A444VQL8_9FLAO|nr:lantibiotic dehydratase family protein [Allomuricauda olearia]RYC53125.1 hypothetical protein DN53_02590 [Allomuricauda olearia]
MKNECQYEIFPDYVLRTPLLSFDTYKQLTSQSVISDETFKDICKDPIIREALYLASPFLWEEIDRWLNMGITDRDKVEKLQYTILKYLSRMASRCTPFGLFAGCAVGRFGDATQMELEGLDKNRRHTKLDMNYLVALSQDLVKNSKIREQLLFYPNTSIYEIGNQLRYVEYRYVNTKRHHQIAAVDQNEYLNKVLEKARQGSRLEELASVLVDDDITYEEAQGYIVELISNQLLVSELEPSVSGPEFLKQICSVLDGMENVEDYVQVLDDVQRQLDGINKTIGNDPKAYWELGEVIKKLETEFDPKYLFQVDMELAHEKNTLSSKIIDDVQKGLTFLNKISIPLEETLLSNFKNAFNERFEGREVPLSTVLDTEIGIGYRQDQGHGDVNPLVDDIVVDLRKKGQQVRNMMWTEVDVFLQKKLLEAHKNNVYTIVLEDSDFEAYEANWDELPDTISCMIELVQVNGEEKIRFKGGGGSSAANLLGRFCHGDKELHEHASKIIDVEEKLNNHKIMAEIVHLPESRVGNILMRPDFRTYEIPYLARSIKPTEQQLPINDLMLSLRNNRLFLRSKKYNKEVVPRLTNAHNYSNKALPIYHFLSDMQKQDNKGGVWFSLDKFAEDFEFFPRVEYHNLILLEATWNLKKSHLKAIIKVKQDNNALLEKVRELREPLQIPQYVKLLDGDNELLVDLENLTSVRMLLDTVAKRDNFRLGEFLHHQEGVVRKNGAYFTNQVILSFYNGQNLNHTST